MYQFYYSQSKEQKTAEYKQDIKDFLNIRTVKPTMWEEHCLECSAPACYKSCPHYISRSDGRCRRFRDGIRVTENSKGCAGQAADIHFLKWSNMMTIIFPDMLEPSELVQLTVKNQNLGKHLKKIADSFLPKICKWECIRTIEYIRRRSLRKETKSDEKPNYFVLHGYSFQRDPYNLVMDIYENDRSVFKKSFQIKNGENLFITEVQELSPLCLKNNNLIKIYPENDIEAELELLWCNFVFAEKTEKNHPSRLVKCVVWDLDKTIWNDTLLETDNPDDLKIRPQVAETVKALDERGILQSISSKNNYEDAWAVVKRLGIADYFLYPQINWDPKSKSIHTIAKNLNINTDTFALIDDSDFERNQVLSELPQVRVYDNQTLGNRLLDLPEFDVQVTEESRKRRQMYQSEQIRNSILEEQGGDIIRFLKECRIKAELFFPEKPEEIERCYELIVRTNQLNMTGNKYTKEKYLQLLNDHKLKTLAFRCSDRYGEYGIVGFMQYHIENNILIFNEFTMSCRVSGKYIESSIFKALLELHHCREGIFPVNKTNKNFLLRKTLEEISCPVINETKQMEIHRIGEDLKYWEITEISIKNGKDNITCP